MNALTRKVEYWEQLLLFFLVHSRRLDPTRSSEQSERCRTKTTTNLLQCPTCRYLSWSGVERRFAAGFTKHAACGLCLVGPARSAVTDIWYSLIQLPGCQTSKNTAARN